MVKPTAGYSAGEWHWPFSGHLLSDPGDAPPVQPSLRATPSITIPPWCPTCGPRGVYPYDDEEPPLVFGCMFCADYFDINGVLIPITSGEDLDASLAQYARGLREGGHTHGSQTTVGPLVPRVGRMVKDNDPGHWGLVVPAPQWKDDDHGS